MKHATRGQSTVEYVVVTAVVIGALLATTIYMKRGKMGDLGRATDQIGSQFNPHQYSGAFRDKSASKRANLQYEDGGELSIIQRAGGEVQKRKGSENLTQSRVGCEQLFDQPAGGASDLTNCPDAPAASSPADVGGPYPSRMVAIPGLMVGDEPVGGQ